MPTAKKHFTYTTEDEVINAAKSIMESRMTYQDNMTSPQLVINFLKVHFVNLEREVFTVLHLNSQNQLIAAENLFFGTIDGASVYPREVVKSALQRNSAAVILAHNHPSGIAEPSEADKRITKRLQDALSLVDIRVLDHIVVGSNNHVSFAERGLL